MSKYSLPFSAWSPDIPLGAVGRVRVIIPFGEQ